MNGIASSFRCVHSWDIELNTPREIPHLHAPMHYSLFSFLFLISVRSSDSQEFIAQSLLPESDESRTNQAKMWLNRLNLLLWATQNKLTALLRRRRFLLGRYPTEYQHSQQDMEYSPISVPWYKWNNYLSFIFSESNNRLQANLATKRTRLTPWASVQLKSHTNVWLPATWYNANISGVDWWVERTRLYRIAVLVSGECLEQNRTTSSHLLFISSLFGCLFVWAGWSFGSYSADEDLLYLSTDILTKDSHNTRGHPLLFPNSVRVL